MPAGVKLTLHWVVPVGGSAQEPPEPKAPPLSLENDTEPDGREAVPASLSETVAVQVVCVPSAVDPGEQPADTDEARLVESTSAVPVLPAYALSPP
jgi:hypothetical protein